MSRQFFSSFYYLDFLGKEQFFYPYEPQLSSRVSKKTSSNDPKNGYHTFCERGDSKVIGKNCSIQKNAGNGCLYAPSPWTIDVTAKC